MVTITTPPFPPPSLAPLLKGNIQRYREDVARYEGDIWAICADGRSLRFPVGDGYAVYFVDTLNPLRLYVSQEGDAYRFPYELTLTTEWVTEELKRSRYFHHEQ